MTITVSTIAESVAGANAAMVDLEQVLNAADAKIGDGDTGGMLARVISKMAETDFSTSEGPGEALMALGKQAMVATGSSLGTLIGAGLLATGRQAKGQQSIDREDIAPLVKAAIAEMIKRGGASLGDKTVLDSLQAIAEGLKSADPDRNAALVAAEAAANAVDAFRDKPNRVGRARMFGEQTVGFDDPGMLAVRELTKALASKA